MTNEIREIVQSRLRNLGGSVLMGESTSYNWIDDPARLLFSLARYKFVAKMFSGFQNVLEVGAADGFGGYIVAQNVKSLTCVDIDPRLVASARQSVSEYSTNITFETGDIEDDQFMPDQLFDGVFLLDVLEHIPIHKENKFLAQICKRMDRYGSLIIGMPSKESQVYASPLSKLGHINCKTQSDLLELCRDYFHVTYMFGANDETIHTGFGPMQHYRLALCVAPRLHHKLK
jgi:2-polyprenyl-3-methyl-5-hydroxy-6-metoxy-1,4-benzoquinol methylase